MTKLKKTKIEKVSAKIVIKNLKSGPHYIKPLVYLDHISRYHGEPRAINHIHEFIQSSDNRLTNSSSIFNYYEPVRYTNSTINSTVSVRVRANQTNTMNNMPQVPSPGHFGQGGGGGQQNQPNGPNNAQGNPRAGAPQNSQSGAHGYSSKIILDPYCDKFFFASFRRFL